jgi:hypothetical protein
MNLRHLKAAIGERQQALRLTFSCTALQSVIGLELNFMPVNVL